MKRPRAPIIEAVPGGVRLTVGAVAIEPGLLTCGDLQAPCPDCAPHGGKGRIPLFSSVSLCRCVAACECGRPVTCELCPCGHVMPGIVVFPCTEIMGHAPGGHHPAAGLRIIDARGIDVTDLEWVTV